MKIDSLLSEVFHIECKSLCPDEKYCNVNKQLADKDDILTDALKDNPDLLAHCKNFRNAQEEYDAISVKKFYSVGLKRGFKLAMETFDIKSPLYAD